VLQRARLLPVVLAGLLTACAARPATSLAAADSAAIRATQAAFVGAWLRDDTSAVLATLDSSAVLLPPRQQPVIGQAAIRAHWWPNDGSRTKITAFELTVDEVKGSGSRAFTRGISTVSWTFDKDTLHQTSTSRSPSLTLLRRSDDGRWLITHQMWGPALP
jgi:ketosteroid isomerase-like protein